MRKISVFTMIITVTLSAVWLDSCCKHKNIVQEDAINLGISEKGTKAVVEDKAGLISQCLSSDTGFGVYGYKSVTGNDPLRIFDNVEVKPESNAADPTWTYSPTRYWDKNPQASYQFIAYWPHLGETSVNGAPYVSEQNKSLTIHDIPFWQDASLAASADFMTARRLGNYSLGSFTENDVTKVRFTFSHILAKFEIRAYYVGVKQSHVRINGISLTPGNSSNPILQTNGKASFTHGFENNQGTATFSGNTPTSTTSHALYAPALTGIELSEDTFDDEIAPQDNEYDDVCAWLMVPCSGWQNLGLSINYSIAGSGSIISNVYGLTLSTTVGENVQTGVTASGKTYVVTLKFDSSGGGVDLYSVLVKDWQTSEIEKTVYNW